MKECVVDRLEKDRQGIAEELDQAVKKFDAHMRRIAAEVLNCPVGIEIKLDPEAKMPTQPYPTDACWDLYVLRSTEVQPHATELVPTGVYIDIPEGYEGNLMIRSGLGKKGLSIHPAVFDVGYQGELSSFVHNRTGEPYLFEKGERVVQFCLRRKVPIDWKQVDELSPTERGSSGQGSSGR